MKNKTTTKKKKLTKNTFVQGAFISTLGIVISKILGIIYVIPFHAIVKVIVIKGKIVNIVVK